MMQRPLGDPGALLQGAGNLTSSDLSGGSSLLDAAKKLQSIAASTSDWKSAGATAFESSVSSFGTGLNAVAQHVQDFANSLKDYANKLQGFQQRWDQLNSQVGSERGAVQALFASMEREVNTPWLVPVGYSGPRHPLTSDLPSFDTSDAALVDGSCASQVSNQSCGVWSQGTKDQCVTVSSDISQMDSAWNQLESDYTAFIKAAPAMFAIDASPASARIADMISTAEQSIDTPMSFDPRAGDPAIPLMEFSSVRIVVQPGDNLTSIAQEFYGTTDWQKVYGNQSVSSQDGNPNLIYAGQNFTLDNTTPPSGTATVPLAVAGVRMDAPAPPAPVAPPASQPAAPAPVNSNPDGLTPPPGTYANGNPVVTQPVCMTAQGWANSYAEAAANGPATVYVTGLSGQVYQITGDGHGAVSLSIRPSANFIGPVEYSASGVSPSVVAGMISGDLPTR